MEPRAENVAIRAIVDDVLAEDESHKAKRKREKDPESKPKKSVRFKDVDDVHEFEVDDTGNQEEGPIKEHLLGEAWQKRQLTRDGKAFNADEINFNLGNEEAPEEDAEYDHLDGEEVSAFNMKDEEAEGFNTLTGEIAPRKSEDDEVAEDPWLLSLQQEEREETQGDDGLMRAKVRRSQVTINEQTKQRLAKEQEAFENREPLSDAELAEARTTLIEHMHPRETVMQTMARLSARPAKGATQSASTCMQKAAGRAGKKHASPEEQARLDLIERFTDAASSLLSTEVDIFEQHREELEHSLRMSTMLRDPAAQPSGAPAVAAPAGGDSDDDMFADSDTEPAEASKDAAVARPAGIASDTNGASAAAAIPAGRPGSLAPPAAHTAADAPAVGAQPAGAGGGGAQSEGSALESASASQVQDYSSWPISELQRVLLEAKIDTSGATEKGDLVELMKELDRQRAPTATPVGFVLDPGSGYFFNAETGWYFHAASGCYYRNGRWYQLDTATGSYQEMQR